MNRRQFLKASGVGLGAAAGFASNLATLNAYAANTSGYKALVCVFLRGGMDSHDLIIPYDLPSSALYEDIRSPLIDGYASEAEGFASRRRAYLLNLTGSGSDAASGFIADGREFALPDEMKELRELYLQKQVAVVGNVGPLLEPLNSTTIASAAARVPPRLYSHNDQQSTWMASSTEGATSGWGGRIGDIMAAANANANSSFTTVTTFGTSVFVNSENITGFNLSTSGGESVDDLNGKFGGTYSFGDAFKRNLYGTNAGATNLFGKDVGSITQSSINDNLAVRDAFATADDPVTPFPDDTLGRQLSIVSKMIAARESFGLGRQIYFVADNGYDTHSYQNTAIPERQRSISQAMNAFYEETVAMGVADSVTAFTASDFGRSLVPNANGTDHGWGGHHLVVGGGVNGGQIYGNIPEAVEGHSQDDGRGRLIPELSVEQYATSMARWFGLSLSECYEVFPNLNSMDPEALTGMMLDV